MITFTFVAYLIAVAITDFIASIGLLADKEVESVSLEAVMT
jgi:hypothetical protein